MKSGNKSLVQMDGIPSTTRVWALQLLKKHAADAVRCGNKPEAKRALDKLEDKPIGHNFKVDKSGNGLPPCTSPDGPSDKKTMGQIQKRGRPG
jgi:hypothetical protein